jgi:tetratricopeptide (TPR) repeat protein
MHRIALLLILVLCGVSACAVQIGTEVQSGRTALMAGNPELALTHFQRGVESQPDYVADLAPLRQGVWTYLGRAYYDAGKLPEASEALTQGLKRNEADFMARLYMGLTLLRVKGPAPKADNSFALADILFALKERVSSKRVAALVKERGTNFSLTGELEKDLRKAGADDEIMEQIRISAKNRARLEGTSGQQGLREAERALREIRSWQDRIKAGEYGRFWDTRKKINLQVETSLTMIATKRTDRPEFISGLEWIGRAIEEEVDLVHRDKLEYERKGGARPG